MRLAIDPAEVKPRIQIAAIRRERERAESAMRTRRALDDIMARAAGVASVKIAPPVVAPEPEPVAVAPKPTPAQIYAAQVSDLSNIVSSLRRVLIAVSAVTGVSVDQIKSYRRTEPVVRARFVYATVARRCTPRSLPEIAKSINKDHSTIVNALRRSDELCAGNPTFAALITSAIELLETRHD